MIVPALVPQQFPQFLPTHRNKTVLSFLLLNALPETGPLCWAALFLHCTLLISCCGWGSQLKNWEGGHWEERNSAETFCDRAPCYTTTTQTQTSCQDLLRNRWCDSTHKRERNRGRGNREEKRQEKNLGNLLKSSSCLKVATQLRLSVVIKKTFLNMTSHRCLKFDTWYGLQCCLSIKCAMEIKFYTPFTRPCIKAPYFLVEMHSDDCMCTPYIWI